jgi:hypothetical protein
MSIARLDENTFLHCMSFLKVSELGLIASPISKIWKALIDGNGGHFWRVVSRIEGVPTVKGGSDGKEEFRLLYSITISGEMIGKYYGEVVGEVPEIPLDRYLQLRDSKDPFDLTKSMRENYVVLVDPRELKIRVGPPDKAGINRPLFLDESGTLVEVSLENRANIVETDLIVQATLKNLGMFAKYPLAGGDNGPVFYSDGCCCYTVERCNAPLQQNGIVIMRKEVVARKMSFKDQEALVTDQSEWKVGKVRERAFYSAFQTLSTGTCPHGGQSSPTFVRSGEVVFVVNGDDQIAGVGEGPKEGLLVSYQTGCGEDERFGVVPCMYPESS